MITTVISLGDNVPFSCVFIDAELKEILRAIQRCFATERTKSRAQSAVKLAELFATSHHRHVLPCLSVRSAFDLFLLASKFKEGSEIIMSAINIPDMAEIARHHGLRIVPLDVDIETLEPKRDLLPHLITERTVVILVAHLFGSTYDVTSCIQIARSVGRSILFVEDCAQCFTGLDGTGYVGHPLSDAIFYSFGIIKRRTCFGGAVAKINDDRLYESMLDTQRSFALQTNSEHLERLVQYLAIYFVLNVPALIRPAMTLGKWAKWDYQTTILYWLRYAGKDQDLVSRIRKRPSSALMVTMAQRLGADHVSSTALAADVDRMLLKRQLVWDLLPDDVIPVGRKAAVQPNWLFPVLVKDSNNFSAILNRLGVESYKGATQLKAILDPACLCRCRSSPSTAKCLFPHDAVHLIDHVVYLPVHRNVPDEYLRLICEVASVAAKECSTLERTELTKSKL